MIPRSPNRRIGFVVWLLRKWKGFWTTSWLYLNNSLVELSTSTSALKLILILLRFPNSCRYSPTYFSRLKWRLRTSHSRELLPSGPTTLMSKAFVFYFGRCPVWISGRTPIFLAKVSSEFATYFIPVNGWKWWASSSGCFTYVTHCTEHLMAPWIGLSHVCTNFGHQLTVVYIFLQTPSNTCGYSVWNLLYVTFLLSRILRWAMGFRKLCVPFV
jgi:hypothetical protein